MMEFDNDGVHRSPIISQSCLYRAYRKSYRKPESVIFLVQSLGRFQTVP